MFTGLVEAVGEIVERTPNDGEGRPFQEQPARGGFRLRIRAALARELATGDSLAVNGVCLTVVCAQGDEIRADVGPETTRVTTLGSMAPGCLVNLERPLRADGRVGGHFVQGHVDGIGRVEALREDAGFHWLTVSCPTELAPYIVQKGSIAVDGISLTVARLSTDQRRMPILDIQLVPYTIEHTNLCRIGIHAAVNLECDIVGKYVVRAAEVAGLVLSRGERGESTP